MRRRLRILLSYLIFAAWILLAASWIYSRGTTTVYTCQMRPYGGFFVNAWSGQIQCSAFWYRESLRRKDGKPKRPTDFDFDIEAFQLGDSGTEPVFFGYGVRAEATSDNATVAFPHWAALIVAGAVGLLVRPSPRCRFSLRESFALVTITAVVLGFYLSVVPLAGSD